MAKWYCKRSISLRSSPIRLSSFTLNSSDYCVCQMSIPNKYARSTHVRVRNQKQIYGKKNLNSCPFPTPHSSACSLCKVGWIRSSPLLYYIYKITKLEKSFSFKCAGIRMLYADADGCMVYRGVPWTVVSTTYLQMYLFLFLFMFPRCVLDVFLRCSFGAEIEMRMPWKAISKVRFYFLYEIRICISSVFFLPSPHTSKWIRSCSGSFTCNRE